MHFENIIIAAVAKHLRSSQQQWTLRQWTLGFNATF